MSRLPRNSILAKVKGNTEKVVKLMKAVAIMGSNEPYLNDLYHEYLEGKTPEQQAKAIFNYAYQIAHFSPDPIDVQNIRSAVRTMKDGYANCVDYSVLISSLLFLCDIPHSMRRVKIGGSDKFVHIYIVLENGTALDCVIGQRQDGQEEYLRENKFGSYGVQLPYDQKHDTKII